MRAPSFFTHLALSRERIAARTYKRDREGKFSSGSGGGVADLPRLDRAPTVQQAAEGSNPHYGSTAENPTYREAGKAGEDWTPEMGPPPRDAYEENCTNTVQAFEMRMRGYDVAAAPLHVLDRYGYASGRTPKEMDEHLAASWTLPGGRPHGRSWAGQRWRSFDEIDKEVAGWPEGGRGVVNVGKHVFSVVKVKGKAQYVEPQFDETPSRVVTRQYKSKYGVGGRGGREEAKVIRLDDLEPAGGILDSVVPA